MKVIILTHGKNDMFLEVKNIKDELKTFYKIIGCNYIDIINRKIGKNRYNLIIDDEGAINGSLPSMVGKDQKEVLFGNIIISGKAEDGELMSIQDSDINDIIEHFSKNGLSYDF